MEFDNIAMDMDLQNSMLGWFLHADIVIKIVMVILVSASIWSWAIIFSKWFVLSSVTRHALKFEKAFLSGQSMDDYALRPHERRADIMAHAYSAALREWREWRDQKTDPGQIDQMLVECTQRSINGVIERGLARMETDLPVLATIGSATPFIGLFGTVWGIMNAFRAIAISQETNLAVVAPGIAEALFATALGLFAAIPAVIFYNKFSSDIMRLGSRLDMFCEEFLLRLSRRIGRVEG